MTAATSFAVAAFGILLASVTRTRAQLAAFSTLIVLTMSAVPEALPLPAQLIADTHGQENLVSYRWHAALYPVLAPLDDEINIGTGLRFTFRIFALANAVGPNRQWFRDPVEGELSSQGILLVVDPLGRSALENDKRKFFHIQKRRAFDLVADLRNTGV